MSNTLQTIHDRYVRAGYRAPKPDGVRGGSAHTDVYVGDIGDDGLYGFCTSDDPKTAISDPGSYDVWAYCVLDDDYTRSQFPTNTPLENMRVTAAHEYFHAVQFGYDFAEDPWLLESTAAWVEDELYDSVDDNRQYLRNSPLRRPRMPLDTFGEEGFHYGTWIFWRYLTEKYRTRAGGLPTLVRDVWRRADGAAGRPDDHSTQALQRCCAPGARRSPSSSRCSPPPTGGRGPSTTRAARRRTGPRPWRRRSRSGRGAPTRPPSAAGSTTSPPRRSATCRAG
ncbi:hypothetical protein MF408_18155 [Nocardioides sp. TF02-7]|nr:MXAN_6640 family putative metalloprotease [Nocardioides sp. TF02-7]UMG91924.1 hypothetical protein MF408_18155 [Nocardioides sp. TF02-7]